MFINTSQPNDITPSLRHPNRKHFKRLCVHKCRNNCYILGYSPVYIVKGIPSSHEMETFMISLVLSFISFMKGCFCWWSCGKTIGLWGNWDIPADCSCLYLRHFIYIHLSRSWNIQFGNNDTVFWGVRCRKIWYEFGPQKSWVYTVDLDECSRFTVQPRKLKGSPTFVSRKIRINKMAKVWN